MLVTLLRVFSALNIAFGVACIIIQVIIITNYGDCAYSKMGVGVWAGVLFILAGIATALTTRASTSSKSKSHLWAVVFCALAFLSALILAGVASGVIYQIRSQDYYDMSDLSEMKERTMKELPRDPVRWVETFLNPGPLLGSIGTKMASTALKNVKYFSQIKLCYQFLMDDSYDTAARDARDARIGLEAILLVSAIISILIDLASILVLRITDATSTNVFIINNQKSAAALVGQNNQLMEIDNEKA